MDQDTARRTVFDAYLVSLPQARAVSADRSALDAFLGDIDRQAGSMDMVERMTLAGRVFAVSVVLAGGEAPDLGEVEALIDALLGYGRSQREEAAPLGDGRLWPEDEAASGLGDLIAGASDDELAEECATIASYLLQFGLRPTMDVGAALSVGEELREIAREGEALLDVAGSFGMADSSPGVLLRRAAARARGIFETTGEPDPDDEEPLQVLSAREAWVQIAAALLAARARWAEEDPGWEAAITRATERIASSLVLTDPTRFAAEACADHAIGVVLDAATMWLDEVVAGDRIGEEEDAREFVWEGLLEAASSGLVGGWVETRR